MLVLVLVALLVGVGNRPEPETSQLPQIDLVVAVDVTTSMSALDDPSGSRITAVRRDLVELSRELESARFTLMSFGGDAEVRLPRTTDRTAFDDAVRALQVESPVAGFGTSLGEVAAPLASELAAARDADRGATVDRVPVVVLATDGENTRPGKQASFLQVGEETTDAVVLGYGTREGGVMPLERVEPTATPPPPARAGALVTDRRTGRAARSRLDAQNLEKVAEELGGSYVAADGTQDVAAVADSIEAVAYADLEPVRPQRELRWLWALALLLLTVPELRQGWGTYLEGRRESSA